MTLRPATSPVSQESDAPDPEVPGTGDREGEPWFSKSIAREKLLCQKIFCWLYLETAVLSGIPDNRQAREGVGAPGMLACAHVRTCVETV